MKPIVCFFLLWLCSPTPAQIVSGTKGNLQIRVIPPSALNSSAKECEVRVEIHNVGRGVAPVYMSGLSVREYFSPIPTSPRSKTSYVADEFGMPINYKRSTSKNEAFDFVILEGGEYHGRTFKFPLLGQVEGTVHLTVEYENTRKGPSKTIPAWMGKISMKSEITVSAK